MMPYFNISGDENIDNAIRLSIEGGDGVAKLIKFIRKHKIIDMDSIIVRDALSMYRCGYYNISNDIRLKELLEQLGAEYPFVFLGNNSDLAYFWKKTAFEEHVKLSLGDIAAIPDDIIRKRTAATMARCYIDGLLDYDAATQTYTLSKSGMEHIYKGEFITGRLIKEAAFYTKAELTLTEEAEEICQRMEERGFGGFNRVTVDRQSLKAEETEKGLFSRIPGTRGKDYICFENGTFFDLSEKTVEVYIDPNKTYTILNECGNAQREIDGSALSKYYEIKSPAKDRAPSHFTEHVTSNVVCENASYQIGDYVFAVNVYEQGYAVNQYRVDYAITDKGTGEILYRLSPTAPGQAEVMQTESCIGKTLFTSRAEASKVLATPEGRQAADAIKATFAKPDAAAKIVASAPKFDLYTAAASATIETVGKAVHNITK